MSDGTLRMRVFAGPNGSGKSTVINSIRETYVNGYPLNLGIYINADDIARCITLSELNFSDYQIQATQQEFHEIALNSGLVAPQQSQAFADSYQLANNTISLLLSGYKDRLAQIIAHFLREKLLALGVRFSFETVFSHQSKIDIMRRAAEKGYKVYLYFVSTESADINVYRVAARKEQGGHDVPEDRIRDRYDRSLNMLYEASQIAYQSYYFDNSTDGADAALFASFKRDNDKKTWSEIDENNVPQWFRIYYSDKIPDSKQPLALAPPAFRAISEIF